MEAKHTASSHPEKPAWKLIPGLSDMLLMVLDRKHFNQIRSLDPYGLKEYEHIPRIPCLNVTFSFTFIRRLIDLPKEIRDDIYSFVISIPDSIEKPSYLRSDWRYERSPITHGFAVKQTSTVASRNFLDGKSWHLDREQFRFLLGFFKSALQFEGFVSQHGIESEEVWERSVDGEERKLGLSDDLLEWFWRTMVLHIYPAGFEFWEDVLTEDAQNTLAQSPIWHNTPLQHVSLLIRKIYNNQDFSSNGIHCQDYRELITYCALISSSFPNLTSITIVLRLDEDLLGSLLDDPVDQPWMRAVNRLGVKVCFVCEVVRHKWRNDYGNDTWGTQNVRWLRRDLWERWEGPLYEEGERVLEELLVPRRASVEGDGEWGLEGLFGGMAM